MCNHIILVLLLIILISLQAVEKSSWWRFYRLLIKYDNPVFRAGDRDVKGRFSRYLFLEGGVNLNASGD